MPFYTIEKRVTKKGDIRYRVTVGVKKGGKYVHRENETFPRKAVVASWGAQEVWRILAGGCHSERAYNGEVYRVRQDAPRRHKCFNSCGGDTWFSCDGSETLVNITLFGSLSSAPIKFSVSKTCFCFEIRYAVATPNPIVELP